MILRTDGRRRRVLAIASIAVAVVVIGGVVAAVTLTGRLPSHNSAGRSGSSAQVLSAKSPFTAEAGVTPPVAASTCKTPMAFTYHGTLSATTAGTLKYQWVYSSGKPGPVDTVRFTAAGHKVVAGATVKSGTAGGGWGEIKMISPAAQTSKKAAYKLLCGDGSAGGITVTAAVQPTARTVSCAVAPPAFTATGAITASKAETVTYYWAQSDGANSAPASLMFSKPGTEAVPPLTISPAAASGSGAAVLVVTSPVTAASSAATYTLTCTASTTSPTVPAAAQGPAGNPPAPTQTASGPAGRPSNPLSSVSVSVNAPATAVYGQPYSGTITATGTDPPFIWSAVSGLPDGLTASANGATLTISGTPTLPGGNWLASGQVSNSNSSIPLTAGWELYFTVIQPPITISCQASEQATVGQPYVGTLTASGGNGTPFTWSIVGIPLDLTGNANGATYTISGTPTGSDVITTTSPPSPGNHELFVTVSDSLNSYGEDCYIVVNP